MSASGEPFQDEAEMHRTKVMAPSGDLAPYIGKITKSEQMILTMLDTLALAVKKEGELKDSVGGECDAAISDIITLFPKRYVSLSGSVDGFRSKQIAKSSVAGKAGGIPPEPEQKPGWVSRNLLRRKKEEVASTG